MMAEEHPEDADTSDKKAKVQKKTKTEKEAEEHHDKDEDMTEKPAAEKKKNTSAKANAKRKPAKKKTKKETHDTDDSRKKKTKQTSRPAANQVTCAKRIQDLPAEDHKKVQKMLDFMAGVADLTEEQAKLLVRGRMKDYPPCRYNVYWPRGAVGLHMRAEKQRFCLL